MTRRFFLSFINHLLFPFGIHVMPVKRVTYLSSITLISVSFSNEIPNISFCYMHFSKREEWKGVKVSWAQSKHILLLLGPASIHEFIVDNDTAGSRVYTH